MARANDKRKFCGGLPAAILLIAGLSQAQACEGESARFFSNGPDSQLLRQYALYNYRQLANDILNGSGIYLEGLYELMHVVCNDQPRLHEDLKKLLVTLPRIPDFAISLGDYVGPSLIPGSVHDGIYVASEETAARGRSD